MFSASSNLQQHTDKLSIVKMRRNSDPSKRNNTYLILSASKKNIITIISRDFEAKASKFFRKYRRIIFLYTNRLVSVAVWTTSNNPFDIQWTDSHDESDEA